MFTLNWKGVQFSQDYLSNYGWNNHKPVHSGIEAVNVPFVIFHGNLSTGMRIVSHGFSIDIDDDDYDNAIEGEYRATIQFNIVVGS